MERSIIEVAKKVIARAQGRAAAIHDELRQGKEHRAANKAELHHAKLSLKRALNFEVRFGPHYQCPSCWVDHGKRSALRGIQETANEDIIGCITCGLMITAPFSRP